MGVANYNDKCRSVVMKYSGEWRRIITRLGRWIDFEKDYKTMDLKYMQSVWWIFKEIYKQGLVYKGCKIMPYSNACNTALSNFEAGQDYRDVTDPAIVCSFPLVEDPETHLCIWTTTPWTLPTNFAVCVNPEFDYVKVRDFKRNKVLIIAECRLSELYNVKKEGDAEKPAEKKKPKKKNNKQKGKVDAGVEVKEEVEELPANDEPEFEILERFKGITLEGKEYVPLFDYYTERREDGCFRVVCDPYVTSSDGTGLVHCSPAYGDDDYKVCLKYKMIKSSDPGISVDDNGCFLPKVKDFAGQFIKDADKNIIKNLKSRDRVVKDSQCKHSYPFCNRSGTPLIYKAVSTWFINVIDLKDKLIANNKKAYWVPNFAKEGRFASWLENATDWCFSRSRCWGNPIPLWVSEDGEEVVCVGSIEELEQLTGATGIKDLHREFVDNLTIPSKMGKGPLRRIDDVFDCWFESGSMPMASFGYPFDISEEDFNKRFPADFIGEG